MPAIDDDDTAAEIGRLAEALEEAEAETERVRAEAETEREALEAEVERLQTALSEAAEQFCRGDLIAAKAEIDNAL